MLPQFAVQLEYEAKNQQNDHWILLALDKQELMRSLLVLVRTDLRPVKTAD